MRYLPPDISYGIECAVECFDITEDVGTFFYSFNDRNFSDEHDALDNAEFTWDACHRRYADLYSRIYSEWFENRATEPQRVWCLRGATLSFSQKLGEAADYLYHQYVSGAINSSHDPSEVANMRLFLNSDYRFEHIKKNVTAMVNRFNVVDCDWLERVFVTPDQVYVAADIEGETHRYMEAAMATVVELDGRLNFEGRLTTPQLSKRVRKKTKQRQKVLTKSAAFLQRLVGPTDAVAFIGGQEISVHGQKYAFHMKKRNLQSMGHSGFQISVMDRASGDRLVDLCWYIPDTPALDQLSALIMMVKTGDEEEIIRVGNHLRISQEARAHPEFSKFLPDEKSTLGGLDTINLDELMAQIETVGAHMNTVLDQAFFNKDRISHSTPGTTKYITYNPETFRVFVDCVNSMVVGLESLPPIARERMVPLRYNEIREISNNLVSERLLTPRRRDITPQQSAMELENMMYQPGAMDRIVTEVVEGEFVD